MLPIPGTPHRFTHLRLAAALGTVVAVAGLLAGAAVAQPRPSDEGARSGCLMVPVEERNNSDIVGMAHLCWDSSEVRASLLTENLTAGHAYTTWFVYFDRPSACANTPCAAPDAMGDDPAGVISRLDGAVAGETGTAHFSGSIRNLRLSQGAEVHLVVFGHGPANTTDGRTLARQLLTPQFPAFGTPMGGAAAEGPVGGLRAVAIFMTN